MVFITLEQQAIVNKKKKEMNKMKKKVALHSLGCKVNAYETEAMGKLFEERGYELVPFEPGADVYVINTCTVTNIADRKSRQMLHKAKKMNENAIVVAVGCYAQAFYEELQKDEAIDLIIGNDRKKEIVDMVEDEKRNRLAVKNINEPGIRQEFEELPIDAMNEHTRAYMKIQDGCNQFCTYCIIPYARGRVRSRKEENILEEVDRLIAAGYKELVLTGIHLSSYGMDFAGKDPVTLIDIIKKIGEKKEIKRIRLGSLEPRVITEDFLEELKKVESFCPHFHLSLQSGCDATLKRMNRHYTAKQFLEGCERIHRYYQNAAITTDVIVGFPGETTEEFEESLSTVKKAGFAKLHVFKYSRREGTIAAAMENQVEETEKTRRSNEMIRVGKEMQKDYLERFVGKSVPVLFEEKTEIDGESYYVGHTMEYMKVAVKCREWTHDPEPENRILTVQLQNLLNDEIVLAIF